MHALTALGGNPRTNDLGCWLWTPALASVSGGSACEWGAGVGLYLYLCHIADWGDRRRKDFDLEVLFINDTYCPDFEKFQFSSSLLRI